MRISVFPCALACVVCLAQATKPTPQRVIEDYLRAQGGAKAIAEIRTETLAGSLMEASTGKTGSYSLILKGPNRFYSEIIVGPERVVAAYNGMSAWAQDGRQGARTLTGMPAKQAEAAGRFWNSRLADVKKDKLDVQLVGVESAGGRDAYHLRVGVGPGLAVGAPDDVFFDTQTHLIARETIAETTEQQFDYSDYRPVNGILVPYRIELRRGGHDYEISVTRAEFNSPVADSVFDFPRETETPLPDIKALVLEITRNQNAIEEMQKQYTCHVITEEQSNRTKGQATVKEFDVFNIAGDEVRHLVAKDGTPLAGDEKRKEDERFNKHFEKLAKRAAELARDPKKREQQDAKDEAKLSDLLRAIRFSNARRERFRGQDVIAVDFGPNPDYKPKKTIESILQKLSGVLWIDDQARDIVRAEAYFSDSAKIAGGVLAALDKGSSFVFEQAKVNDEVWLPVYDEVHLSGRFLFLRAKANQIDRYSECKKFHADSKIVIEGDSVR